MRYMHSPSDQDEDPPDDISVVLALVIVCGVIAAVLLIAAVFVPLEVAR